MSTIAAQGRRVEFEPYNGVTPRGIRGGQDLGPEASSERPWDRVVTLPAGRIRVWQSAEHGRPVVLLHAAGASKEVFRHQFDSALTQTYRLVAIDLPSDPRTDPRLEADAQAAVVAQVLERLGIAEAVFLGWAHGAEVALSPVLDAVHRLGLVVTGTGTGPRCGLAPFGGPGLPILSIQGSDDPVSAADPDGCEATWLWRQRPHVIPQAGHAPFLESPQLFNHLLALFLDEVQPAHAWVEDRAFA